MSKGRSEILDNIIKSINYLRDSNLLPEIPVIESGHQPIVEVAGRSYLLFASNSYLGLNIHPRVIAAAKEAIDQFGTGAGNSRLLSGTLLIHKQLEKKIASFKRAEDSLVFPSGFATNVGLIPSLVNIFSLDAQNTQIKNNTVIFSDELNHASIIEGCRLSRAKVILYNHLDIDDLKNKILVEGTSTTKIIITDGVFSLDGDIAPIDKIVDLARSHDALVVVDDAHGTGILGENGRGIVEHFHVEGEVDVMMGTFSKSLASMGGFVAGTHDLIEYLRVTARSYLFTAGITPSIAATVIEALNIIEQEPELRKKVLSNAKKMRDTLGAMGFNVLNTVTPVIPIVIGDEKTTMLMSHKLYANGVIAPAVRYPAVPKGSARIRFTAMALHEREHLEKFFEVVKMTGRELRIIS